MISRQQFLDRLAREVLVFDGAVGTLLMAEVDLAGRPPEQLNIHRPDVVEAVHRRYVDAGVGIIQTNTFGASRVKLGLFGLADEVEPICRAGVAAARRAAGPGCLVAGCIGPTGALLEPFGELTTLDAYAAFHEQATALAESGVDLFNIETMTDVLEAKLALIAARDAAPDVPVMVSVTFDRGLRTLTGTDPQTAVAILVAAGADVVGTNCGTGPEDALLILRRMHETCDGRPGQAQRWIAGADGRRCCASPWSSRIRRVGTNVCRRRRIGDRRVLRHQPGTPGRRCSPCTGGRTGCSRPCPARLRRERERGRPVRPGLARPADWGTDQPIAAAGPPAGPFVSVTGGYVPRKRAAKRRPGQTSLTSTSATGCPARARRN